MQTTKSSDYEGGDLRLNNIKRFRDKLNISQAALADSMRVAQQAVAKWETGEAMPRADKLPELARILGCTIDELFAEEG